MPAPPADLTELLSKWRKRRPGEWSGRPDLYVALGRRFLERGEPILAYDVFREGLESSPRDPALRRFLALSSARSGASEAAFDILTRLYKEGHRDEETLGILARIHKDMAAGAHTSRERDAQRRKAFALYLKAYLTYRGYYSGINAAALALILGMRERAVHLARDVEKACLLRWRRLDAGNAEAYWIAATLGESLLIQGRWDESFDWYAKAVRVGRGRSADISSTCRQALLIMSATGRDPAGIERVLKIPRVVVFSGHRIDRLGDAAFSKGAEHAVRGEIAARLEKLDAGFGFASAACGSDILFLECMLARKGEIQVVLPFEPAEFRKSSVDAAGPEWGRRFERVLRRAAYIHVAGDHGKAPGDLAYEYTNLLIDGLGRLHAGFLGTEVAALAVWDGRPARGLGGTASAVRRWRSRGLPVEIVAPPARKRPARRSGRFRTEAEPQRIKALVFADVVGFSKLREEQMPQFVDRFMGVAGNILRRSPRKPEYKATWGDALYIVFDDLEDAARFSLDLCERIKRVRWPRLGLPDGLSFRVALHAGPVYVMTDPVTGRRNYMGAHVTRAARIEPIAPPGQIYASQSFAALAAARGISSVTCEYVGQVPLAKRYGSCALYHLRRSRKP